MTTKTKSLRKTPSRGPQGLPINGKARPANPALNNQNRRVLAQHYRAKYGVK